MPVVIHPSAHGANLYKGWPEPAPNASALLRDSLPPGSASNGIQVLQSTWGHGNAALDEPLCPNINGFVNTLIVAYASHHHLVIRPDDVWLAILAQFNLYVLAHAEELRHLFVDHEGKQRLDIIVGPESPAFTSSGIDFTYFVRKVVGEFKNRLRDPDLSSWIIPDFTTTEENDKIVASIIMMGTMSKYFDYGFLIDCGFPSVTLLGERSDYESMLRRLDRFERYGEEPSRFASLLRPVLGRFVRSFDNPAAPDIVRFWQTSFDLDDSECGVEEYSGWLTAFMFWDRDGKVAGYDKSITGSIEDEYEYWYEDGPEEYGDDEGSKPVIIQRPVLAHQQSSDPSVVGRKDIRQLELDGIRYPHVNSENVAPAQVHVEFEFGYLGGPKIMLDMYAGLMGMRLSSSNARSFNDSADAPKTVASLGQSNSSSVNDIAVLDTVSPAAAWWVIEDVNRNNREMNYGALDSIKLDYAGIHPQTQNRAMPSSMVA